MMQERVGSGEAAFMYLAPYIFRVAISNNRIVKLEDGKVTFKYKESDTDQIKFSTATAEEFVRRFLQHVLPKRFVKVRYYGLRELSVHPRHAKSYYVRRGSLDFLRSPRFSAFQLNHQICDLPLFIFDEAVG